MNPNTPPPSDDDLPEEHELAALYARLPRIEPDAALDAAVLAQATRALPLRRRRPRWPLALGSAAVLVLTVGVAWQVRDTRPEPHVTLPAPAVEPTVPSAERAPVPAAAPAPPPPDAGAPARPRVQAQAAQPLARSTTSGHVALRVMRAPAPAPAPMPSAPPAPPAPPSPPAPVVASAPPVPAEPAVAPGIVLQSPGVQESAAPSAWEAKPVPAVGGARKSAYLPKLDLAPDDRVGEIRRLLDAGHRDEALRRLGELRERYPRYELPQDLRDLKP